MYLYGNENLPIRLRIWTKKKSLTFSCLILKFCLQKILTQILIIKNFHVTITFTI